MQAQLTITAEQISHRIPMTVVCLRDSHVFTGERVTFTQQKKVCGEWVLIGKTIDNSKVISIFEKNEKFGLIQEENVQDEKRY